MPKFVWSGADCECQALVMELLGPSLESVVKEYGRKFSIPTTVMLGCQMINLIEFMHSRSLLHRDVKPDNFVMGMKSKKDIVHIIDFGLSRYYRDTKSKLHIPYRDNKSLVGTVRYASINTHIGIEQSRRNDVESLLYGLIYFAKGSLPWQHVKSLTDKYMRVMECKLATPIELLCKGLPREFASLLYYARGLKFEEKPDYNYLRNNLLNLLPKKYFTKRLVLESAPIESVFHPLHPHRRRRL